MIVLPVAPDLTLFSASRPRFAFNQYLVGDVLLDAGTRFAQHRLMRSLHGRPLRAHLLSHAHPDHQGASAAICQARSIPLWCGELDAPAAQDPAIMLHRLKLHGLPLLVARLWAGSGHPVARPIRDGDEIAAGFVALHAPGHTLGHLALWRESDRTLLLGDVLANLHFLTLQDGLREPVPAFSQNVQANRDSARRLAGLNPKLIAFGHGPPSQKIAAFHRFVARLPT